MALRVAWFVGLVLTIGLINPINSYATQEPGPLKWQLVFISSYPACSNYQYQMTALYDSIAAHYMDLYKVENEKYKPTCIADRHYSKSSLPDDLNLLILVYDRGIGRTELNKNDLGGFYHHVGIDKTKNNTIVLCDCPDFKFSEPTWILTHELSHFILYYKGFGSEIVEDMIHSKDLRYDSCIEAGYTNEACKTVKTKLFLPEFSYGFTVMSPFEPSENAKQLTSAEKKLFEFPAFINVQKQITQWWVLDKISDEDYAKVLGFTVGSKASIKVPDISFDSRKMLFTTDPPKDLKGEIVSNDGNLPVSDDKLSYLLQRVPTSVTSDNLDNNENASSLLPDWFKTTSMWWSEGKISNEEYFKSVEYLLKN